MTRRRFVVLASGATLIGLLALVMLALVLATQTDVGRERLRRLAESAVNRAIKGRLHLGKLGGSIVGGFVTIDSVDLRDLDDSLFVATGPVEVGYSLADLADRRILLTSLRVTRPVVRIVEDSTGTFNFRHIFPPGPPGPPGLPTTRNWGDYIAARTVHVDSLALFLATRWVPDDSLRGAARDSAVAYALSRTDQEFRRRGRGFLHVQRWTNGVIDLRSARIDDREPTGRLFDVRHLDIDESDPPFAFRNATGVIGMAGDSLWMRIAHFELPGSRGTMTGTVQWGNDLPTRFNLDIAADTVSLADVAWVYPTLPHGGGGRMHLRIRNERDPRILDYILTDMDVRTTESWLRGKMTFGIGGPVTLVKDVDLVAQPVDFKLIEALGGEPLPYPWRGTLTGTLTASGGPVNDFQVDAVDLVFRDANVPGAVTIGRAHGGLDILRPSFTVFHNFEVQLDQLDLRTLQYLTPEFPRLNGVVAGTATLDSSWLDVRLRNADLTHRDGTGPETRMTGGGRVTFGENATTYDLALDAKPLSFTTLARAYPVARIPVTGEYDGPLRLQGSLQDLALSGDLRGPAGRLAYDGRVDADSVGGYGVHGVLTYAGLDLRTLLDSAVTPHTDLSGDLQLDVTGDSLANLAGRASIRLERSRWDSVVVYRQSEARLHFADGRIHVDTVWLESVAGKLTAKGALGLSRLVDDSLQFRILADSLGGLRRLLGPRASAGGAPVGRDSLAGRLELVGTVVGSVDSLGVHAAFRADSVDAMGIRASHGFGRVDVDDLLRNPHGTVRATLDTASAAGVGLSTAYAELTLQPDSTGAFQASATATQGPRLETSGSLAFAGDTTLVRLQEFGLSMPDHRFTLVGESHVRVEPARLTIDSLRLDGARGEQVSVQANLPRDLPVQARLHAENVHLADLAVLTRSPYSVDGTLTANVDVQGTRASPEMAITGHIDGAQVGQVSVAQVSMNGQYRDRRLTGTMELRQRDTLVANVTASYPVDLALESRAVRSLDSDSMRVSLRSRDVDLALLGSFTPAIQRASGRFSAFMDFGGVAGGPQLSGTASIASGRATLPNLGITLDRINADVTAQHDTLYLRRFSMVSGEDAGDSLWLSGTLTHPLDKERTEFNVAMGAREFHAINVRRLADLTLSADVRLTGPFNRAEANGRLTVNKGQLIIPEYSDKNLFPIDEELLAGSDSARLRRLNLLRSAPSGLISGIAVPNLQVVMGPDVWLRSQEASIKLADTVNVTVSRPKSQGEKPQLALEGRLRTERGQYRLNLGPVQKLFTIETGQLTFRGEPEFNPQLDISALYTVRQIQATYGGRNDVRIRAHLTGRLLQPYVSLESADSLPLSQSDILSYLVTNGPSFSIGGGFRENASMAGSIVLGSLSSLVSSRLSGGLFDYVQLQTASDPFAASSRQRSWTDVFRGAQLGVGKQLNNRIFFALSAGLCQFQQLFGSSLSTVDPSTIASSVGGKLEYQLKDGYGASLSYEPSASALLCSQTADRGFSTAQRQIGLDLFRVWRF